MYIILYQGYQGNNTLIIFTMSITLHIIYVHVHVPLYYWRGTISVSSSSLLVCVVLSIVP